MTSSRSAVALRLSIACIAVIGARGAYATTYTVTDLDPGMYSAQPIAINNFGQVVGDTMGSFGYANTSTGSAFLWQPSTANATVGTISTPFAPGSVSAVTGINSKGQFTGYSAPAPGGTFITYLFTPTAANTKTGSIATLPITPPASGIFSFQGGINDVGEVTAEQETNTLQAAIFSPTTPNANTGTVTTLTPAFYVPGAIANSGQVVGALARYGGTYQAGRFIPSTLNGTSGNYVDIADPGQGGTQFQGPGGAISVNSVGDVAGGASPALSTPRHAIIWKATGQVIDLDPQLGGEGGVAIGINDADQVVGQSANSTAFLYAAGTVYNLNSLITDPTWTLQSATAINNKGQIIGEGHHNGSAASFLLTPVTAAAPPSQWISAVSGGWNVSANWSAGVPDTAGAEADFFGAISSNQTVYTNVPVTAGIINFNNSNTYVVTGSSTLTLLASTGTAQITVQSGTQELDLPLYVASNAVFNAASGATLIIANPITIISGNHVSTTGSGTVLFQSQITLQNGSSLNINGSNYASALTIGPAATVTVANHGLAPVSMLQLDNLSVAGTLDLTNNDLIVRNGNLAAVTLLAQNGYYNGSGGQITSSTAHSNSTHLTTVGVISNLQNGGQLYGNNHLFDGTSPGAGDILVKYTYYGDANLDGKVDGSDYSRIDNGYLTHTTGWANGDFNYDGVVDGSDYALIDNAFNTQGAQFNSQAGTVTAQIASTTAVPEPASWGALAMAALSVLRRRRLIGASIVTTGRAG